MPTARDQLVADAKDLPGLIAAAQAADPTLFKMLTGNGTKSVWYAPVASAVAAVAAHFGLGWDADTCGAIAGVVLFAGTAMVHWLAPKLAMPRTAP